MPAWITVYLQTPLTELSSDEISRGVASSDWWTLGERIGMTDDSVDLFMQRLRWTAHALEFKVEPDQRPVQFSLWTDLERVKEEIDELELRENVIISERVRHHLASVCSVVAIELGWTQLQTMYEIVAFEIAYWLAEAFNGLILSSDDQWYDFSANRWKSITE